MKRLIPAILSLAAIGNIAAGAEAVTITHTVYPSDVPDEQPPRANLGDAPTGFGPNSWQGPATGKSNYHVRYQADGDALSILFPNDADTLTLNGIESISYYTNRPEGTPAGQDWWINLYTRPLDGEYSVKGPDDDSAWYSKRFVNNFDDHTSTDVWTQYSTSDPDWTFRRTSGIGGAEQSFGDFQAAFANELVEMISVHTDSGWNGFDGFIDGLEITLANGNIGRVNFEAVPEPASMALVGLAATGLLAMRRRRRA